MFQQCHSCGMPLTGDPGANGNYCRYCTDDAGNLKPRADVRAGITQWLQSWAPNKDADFDARADSYMRAMPAWAEKE